MDGKPDRWIRSVPERRSEYVEALKRHGHGPPDEATMTLLWQIVDEGTLGASKHVALGIDLIRHILDTYVDPVDASVRARMAIDFIAETRGRDTPVIGNTLSLLMAGLDDLPEKNRAAELKARAESWAKTAADRKQRLVDRAATHLAAVRGLLAFDYSSTVAAIVHRLATQTEPPIVVVPESRSIAGGVRYLQEFLPAGIGVRFIPDAAIEHGLAACDAVLLGVETLRADGSFLNTVGSVLTARLAARLGIHVYACTDLMKLDRRSYEGYRISPATRDYDELLLAGLDLPRLELVDTRAPELEVVPPDLTTAFLTEYGPITPAAIWALGRQAFEEGPGQGPAR